MSVALERAAANIPEWNRMAKVNEAATKALAEEFDRPTEQRAFEQAVVEAEALLEAGEPVPDSIGDLVTSLKSTIERRNVRDAVLRHIQAKTANRDYLLATNLTLVLEGLDSQMQELVSQVRALAPRLDGATTAEQAIAAGDDVVAAWAELEEHVFTYEEIRLTQQRLYLDQTPGTVDQTLVRGGLFEDALDVHPYFVARRMAVLRTGEDRELDQWRESGLTMLDFPQYTDISGDRTWWLWEPRARHLLWAATKAKPWVPAPALAFKMLELASAATSDGDVRAVREARDDYYRRTVSHSATPTKVPSLHPSHVGSALKAASARAASKDQMP